ncbi:60S ribosomal protein L31 [Candidatus Woesearchaeota archaeon]|nr:60S ribosomal protein L31 [Candidatus Woesearchaeota archaeon]
MADTTTKVERTYNVPLRVEWLKAPKYRRAKKALIGLRQFISKHMKSDDVSIGQYANEAIWAKGIQSPPHHLKVSVLKQADGKVYVELFGKPIVTEKKEEKKSLAEKLGMKKKKGGADVKDAEIKDAEVVSETKDENKEAVEKKEVTESKTEDKTETEKEIKPKKVKKVKEEVIEAEVKE